MVFNQLQECLILTTTLPYPTDSLRYQHFVPESKEHGAKLELRTFIWIVEQYTSPGDTILDPMSGIGTVHWAATMGRRTIAIEIASRFVEIQQMNIEALRKKPGYVVGIEPQLLYMDCRRALPLAEKVDATIFSPPYSNVMAKGQSQGFKKPDGTAMNLGSLGYDEQGANIGNMSTYFQYLTAMKVVYGLCNQSMKMGAPLIIVTKDHTSHDQRVYVTKDNIAQAYQVGFTVDAWHFREAQTGMVNVVRKQRKDRGVYRPELDVTMEDIVVMRKVLEA